MTIVALPLLGGAIADVPSDARGRKLWSDREDAKCWAAIVSSNARVAGGLDREFLTTARGEGLFYLARIIKPGDVLEFACDRIFADQRKRNRVYARVLAKTDLELQLEVHDTPVAAFLAARSST